MLLSCILTINKKNRNGIIKPFVALPLGQEVHGAPGKEKYNFEFRTDSLFSSRSNVIESDMRDMRISWSDHKESRPGSI